MVPQRHHAAHRSGRTPPSRGLLLLWPTPAWRFRLSFQHVHGARVNTSGIELQHDPHPGSAPYHNSHPNILKHSQ